jgi:1A family penicillin-binding protein
MKQNDQIVRPHFTKQKKKIGHYIKEILLICVIALTLIGSGGILWVASFKVPDLDAFEKRKVSQSTKIFDKTGQILLYDVHENIKRTLISSDDISPQIKNATVAIEDNEFYQHIGIRPLSIVRAVLANLRGTSYNQGGSTITQQVVKNAILTQDKTITRKLKEWVLSVKLEQIMDKDSILALYLNEAPYGGSVYGIEEASQLFFHKKASEVDLAESAYLAAIPNAPSRYSPYGGNKAGLDDRKNMVLQKMRDNNFITAEEYDTALKEKVIFFPQPDTGIKAPHFVMFIKQYLEDKYGSQAIEERGFRVITTLDHDLQKKGEELAKKYALDNKKNFNAENVSLVAIDPKTGNIETMIGSRDYFDKEIDGNFNVALAHRQPGSSFKPFVYATAFNKGYTPDTTLFDLKTEFSTLCNPDGTPIRPGNNDKCYMPENYDHVYVGPISLRNALAQSRNVPAIKTLYLAGMKDSLRTAKDFGITSLSTPGQYGLTLVLGGGEVSLLEMTSAYGVFANNGNRVPYNGVLRIEDKDGNIIEKNEPTETPVMSEQTVLQISDILTDEKARAPAFGSHSFLYFDNRQVAVKTGTTNDYKDAWIVGYTPSLSVGAWAGNNNNTSMEKKVAGYIIAPFWHAFMLEALKTVPVETFKKPEPTPLAVKPILRGFWQGNNTYTIDIISGKIATEFTPEEFRKEKSIQDVRSILFWVNKDDPKGVPPTDPASDSQFELWEYPIRQWVIKNGIQQQTNLSIPTTTDDIHRPDLAPIITLTSPLPNTIYKQNDKIVIAFTTKSTRPISKADYFINGMYSGSLKTAPFTYVVDISNTENISQNNEIKVVVYDDLLNKGESMTSFSVILQNTNSLNP